MASSLEDLSKDAILEYRKELLKIRKKLLNHVHTSKHRHERNRFQGTLNDVESRVREINDIVREGRYRRV